MSSFQRDRRRHERSKIRVPIGAEGSKTLAQRLPTLASAAAI
jgi:hypothetical protein